MEHGAWRLAACALVSVGAHLAVAGGLHRLPRRPELPRAEAISIEVVAPAPPPPPEPQPTALPPPVPHERRRARPRPSVAPSAPPREAPPTDRPPPPTPASTTPVFGVNMESTSQAGTGPAVPVGNTGRPTARPADGAPAHPLPAPLAAYDVTTMPLPQERCAGRYTDEARRAGLEGTVVLDLIVAEDGQVRDVAVVSGLGHGLTAAAVAAARACRFTPGEKDGIPVAVRVRGFKIRFVLDSGE